LFKILKYGVFENKELHVAKPPKPALAIDDDKLSATFDTYMYTSHERYVPSDLKISSALEMLHLQIIFPARSACSLALQAPLQMQPRMMIHPYRYTAIYGYTLVAVMLA
jgi:hypothetical protein